MVMEIASNLLFFHSIPSRQSIIKPITILEPTLSHHPHSSPAAHHTTLLIKYCYFNGFPFRHLIWYGTVVFHLFLPLTVNRDETDSNSRHFTDQQIPIPHSQEHGRRVFQNKPHYCGLQRRDNGNVIGNSPYLCVSTSKTRESMRNSKFLAIFMFRILSSCMQIANIFI